MSIAPPPGPAAAIADPADQLGPAYEAALDRGRRHATGAFYTPTVVATGLVALAVDGLDLAPPRRPTVCDPAVGGGAFLLAAARELEAAGHTRGEIVDELLWGADIDPEAVDVTRTALRDWAAGAGVRAGARHVVVADSLAVGRAAWPGAPLGGFDLIVGNPPFQSQLGRDTARTASDLAVVRDRLGALVAPYADSAALFLADACRSVAPGGRVVLVLPESVLAARDAAGARAAALEKCALTGFWWAGASVFDASVDVCAPVFARGAAVARSVPRWEGSAMAPRPPAPVDATTLAGGASWSALLAHPDDPAPVDLDASRTMAGIATATAGFRDQFYGVAPFVTEADPAARARDDSVRLVTAGLLDPLRCRWGSAPTRFAGRRWEAPVVELDLLGAADPGLARWARHQLVPKVVLATQTRVLEPAVDTEGSWWPSVPTIAVVPRTGTMPDLWPIAAVLAAPPVSGWALSRCAGSAMSRGAIKLSARQVLEIPLPTDDRAWSAGARQAARAHRAARLGDPVAWRSALTSLGSAMTAAYAASDELLAWWVARLPDWR